MNIKALLACAISLTLLTACATNDPNRRAKTGAAIGALTGAILGNQTGSKTGQAFGIALGALTGAAAGNYMDEQQNELERQLAEEQAANEIELQRVDDETLKLNLSSEVTFDINSSVVNSGFDHSLDKLAKVLAQYDKTAVHIIGHTDNTGSDSYNQKLSERRAQSVGSYLASRGVNYNRTRLDGRGESQPRATNSSEYGRRQNRRVEIYLKSIVEGREEQAFQAPI